MKRSDRIAREVFQVTVRPGSKPVLGAKNISDALLIMSSTGETGGRAAVLKAAAIEIRELRKQLKQARKARVTLAFITDCDCEGNK